MHFQEHHFRNLGRARDHLSETMLSLQSAIDRMTGDDWIDAKVLLDEIQEDIGPRLGRLRTNASERFDEHTRREDWEAMRTGKLPFPDERLAVAGAADAARRRSSTTRRAWSARTPSAAPSWWPCTAASTPR